MSARQTFNPLATPVFTALNHLLDRANWAKQRLIRYHGREVSMVMPPFALTFMIGPDGTLVPSPDSTVPTVTLYFPPESPLLLLQGFDKAISSVQVEGNADFATELSFVFRHLGWDFEEDLAHVFGDIAAHRMMQSTRKLLHGTTDSAARFSANLSEYAAHELNLLVSSTEFNHFRANIAELSAQLARFDLQIARYATNRL